ASALMWAAAAPAPEATTPAASASGSAAATGLVSASEPMVSGPALVEWKWGTLKQNGMRRKKAPPGLSQRGCCDRQQMAVRSDGVALGGAGDGKTADRSENLSHCECGSAFFDYRKGRSTE